MADGMLPTLKKREHLRCGDTPAIDEVSLFIEKQQRKELLLLQRDFRRLEMEHAPDKSMVVRQIELETNTRDDLKLCLELAKGRYFRELAETADRTVKEALERLILEAEICNACMQQILESDKAIDSMIKKLTLFKMSYSRKMNIAANSADAYDRRLDTLKGRLHVAHVHCNQLLHSNVVIRHEINDLLSARGIFHRNYKRFQRSVYIVKQNQHRTVAKAHQAYDVIEDCKNRIKLIMKHDDELSRHHAIEIAEQKRSVDEVVKMRVFERTKRKPRSALESDNTRKYRRLRALEAHYGRLIWRYRRAFKHILTSLPSLNTDTIMKYYSGLEENNFTLFRRNTDLMAEITVLLREISEFHSKNLRLKKESERRRTLMKERLADLRDVLNENRLKRNYWQEMWAIQQFTMKDLVDGIGQLCDDIEADKAAIVHLLGRNIADLGPRNLPFILHVIERRISQMLQIKTQLEALAARREGKVKLAPKIGIREKVVSQGGPFVPKVFMAAHHPADIEDEDVEDKLFSGKVFTKDEMREYCRERINAVEAAAQRSSRHSSTIHMSRLSVRLTSGKGIA